MRSDTATVDAPRIATTKIQPARPRARRIDRPTLDAALLQAALSQRVVLVVAPAGFGKTTALATLVAALQDPQGPAGAGTALAWVTMDADDDAARLFACLAAALEPYDLPWRTLPDALIPQVAAGGEGARRALVELVNAMARADVPRGVIVLDDLHRVTNRELALLGEELIERLPPNWAVVLSSRLAPAMSLSRVRAAGELAAFEQEQLRFSSAESAALIAVEGMTEAAQRAPTLIERNHGWPAGLRLTLAALNARPGLAAGALTDRYLFEYLTSEVLDALPSALHDFLLRVSVLPELTASRAAAVSGDWRAADRLDEIEKRGLFVTTLANSERTLVLHDLLRDALQERLARRLPDERVVLLERAAASEPDPARRVGYLLRAQNWAAAEDVLDAAAPDLFVAGGIAEVQRLIDQFDATWREQSARLARLAGTVSLLRWDWPATERHLSRAAALAPEHSAERQHAQAVLPTALYAMDRNEQAEALIAELRGQALEPRTRRFLLMSDATQHFRRGEHERLLVLYAEVVESLLRGASPFDWWACVPASNWSTLPGMRALYERYIAGALARIGDRQLPMRGDVIGQRAFAHLWAGRIDAAREDIRQVEDDLRWLACSGETEVAAQLFRLIEGAISGRAGELRGRLDAMLAREADAAPDRRRLWQHQIAVYGVRMNDTLGSPPEVLAHWAAFLKEDPLRSDQHHNPRALAVRARFAAAGGRWREAAGLFQRLLPKLATMDVMAHHVELRLRGAHAWLRCADLDSAAEFARPALERIERDGDIGHAWMAGPAELRALADATWGLRLTTPLRQVLHQAAVTAEQLRGAAVASAATAPVPHTAANDSELSSREAEVLALIAAGQSNKLIARALDISPHTVKRHVANILGKLGLESRSQATAWHVKRYG